MNRLMLIPVLFSMASFVSAQAPSFFKEGSRWVYSTTESFEPGQQIHHSWMEQNLIHGDTLMDGVLYQKLYTTFHFTTTAYMPAPFPPVITKSQDSVGPTFIRHDVIENKVYYRPSVDSAERIIYDFNLQVGDMTSMQSSNFELAGVIDSIENVSLFGSPVKKFYLAGNGGEPFYQENYILEGLGGSNGLTYFQPVFLLVSGGIYTTSLTCFQSGDHIYSPTNSDCPFLEFVSTNIAISEVSTVSIAPNPTQGIFSLFVTEGLRNATFVVTDCLGRRVQSSILTDPYMVGQLPASGIYFWFIEKDGRRIKTGKLICE